MLKILSNRQPANFPLFLSFIGCEVAETNDLPRIRYPRAEEQTVLSQPAQLLSRSRPNVGD